MSEKQFSDLPIVDAHEDIAYHIIHHKRDFEDSNYPCQITLHWLLRGKIKLVFNTVFTHPQHRKGSAYDDAMHQLDVYDSIYERHGEYVMPIKNLSDLSELLHSSKIGFLTMIEGAEPIESPEQLETFYDRGVRMISLSWNNPNIYASGHEGNHGVTRLGRHLLEGMNRLGITLDLSHLNEKGFWDAIGLTSLIPVATHSGARAIRNHPRNLWDEQLKAIADRGGVVGVVFYGPFLSDGKATIDDIFKHIDYMVSLIGDDHVGIGSDLDGGPMEAFPPEIGTVADLPRLAKFLAKKGYRYETIKKIMGGNFLRVLNKNLALTNE